MWFSYNLKMVEFRTNLLPRWGFKVHEVERIENASKLLWHNAKAIKDHISRSILDLDVVLNAQLEFPSNPMHFSFNSVKPQFWSQMTPSQENNTIFVLLRPFEYPIWISSNLKMVEFRTNLLPRWGFKVHEVVRIQNASKLSWHNAKAIKDHISWLFLDLDVVLHAQFEFPSISMYFPFNSVKPQFWS